MKDRIAVSDSRQTFFSPEFLAQLERLSLLSRRAFRGSVKGERRSPRRGHSVEFADYRAYGVGDDLRYVDWNIYGRLDRLHVKLFVDEEDLCLHVLADASASMELSTKSATAAAKSYPMSRRDVISRRAPGMKDRSAGTENDEVHEVRLD